MAKAWEKEGNAVGENMMCLQAAAVRADASPRGMGNVVVAWILEGNFEVTWKIKSNQIEKTSASARVLAYAREDKCSLANHSQ